MLCDRLSGGEVQISPVVNVFSLSPFLTNHSSDEVVERTVQIFLFAVMLFCYIGEIDFRADSDALHYSL